VLSSYESVFKRFAERGTEDVHRILEVFAKDLGRQEKTGFMSARTGKTTQSILEHYKVVNFFKAESRQSTKGVGGVHSRALSSVQMERHKRIASVDIKKESLPAVQTKKNKEEKRLEEKREIYSSLITKPSKLKSQRATGYMTQRAERSSMLMQAPGSSFDPPRTNFQNLKPKK